MPSTAVFRRGSQYTLPLLEVLCTLSLLRSFPTGSGTSLKIKSTFPIPAVVDTSYDPSYTLGKWVMMSAIVVLASMSSRESSGALWTLIIDRALADLDSMAKEPPYPKAREESKLMSASISLQIVDCQYRQKSREEETYALLVDIDNVVFFPSLRRVTCGLIAALDVDKVIPLEILKYPVIGMFDVDIVAVWAFND